MVEEVGDPRLPRYEQGNLYDPRLGPDAPTNLFRFMMPPAEVGEIIVLRRKDWELMGWSYADKTYNRGRKSPPWECKWKIFRNPWAAARYAEELRKGMLE